MIVMFGIVCVSKQTVRFAHQLRPLRGSGVVIVGVGVWGTQLQFGSQMQCERVTETKPKTTNSSSIHTRPIGPREGTYPWGGGPTGWIPHQLRTPVYMAHVCHVSIHHAWYHVCRCIHRVIWMLLLICLSSTILDVGSCC